MQQADRAATSVCPQRRHHKQRRKYVQQDNSQEQLVYHELATSAKRPEQTGRMRHTGVVLSLSHDE